MPNKLILIVIVAFVLVGMVWMFTGSSTSTVSEGLLDKSKASKMYDKIHNDMISGMDFEQFKKKTKTDDSAAYIELRNKYKEKGKKVTYQDYMSVF